jgi:hypothetical protein
MLTRGMLRRGIKNVVTPIVGKVDESALKRLTIGVNEVQSIFMVNFDWRLINLLSVSFIRTC